MARGVNKVILVGNLGNDPETKYTQGGMAVTKVSLATSSERKDKDGNKIEKTEWHRVTFFGKLGEIAGEYMRKGSQVYVEGKISYSESEKDGVKRYYTDILADELQMLGGKQDGGNERQASRPARSEPRSANAGSSRSPMAAPPMDDFSDDDLPF